MRKAIYGIVLWRCGTGEKQRNKFNLSPPQQLFADYSTNLAKEPVNEPAIFTGRERNRHRTCRDCEVCVIAKFRCLLLVELECPLCSLSAASIRLLT
jgi:hypothetical protein